MKKKIGLAAFCAWAACSMVLTAMALGSHSTGCAPEDNGMPQAPSTTQQ